MLVVNPKRDLARSLNEELAADGKLYRAVAGGNFGMDPVWAPLLNKKEADGKRHVYLAWFHPADESCSPERALRGESLGQLYTFAADRDDLHKYGIPGETFESLDERIACSKESFKLACAMIERAQDDVYANGYQGEVKYTYVLATALAGEPCKVGTSDAIPRI